MKKKLKGVLLDSKGFTLAELLITILILLMVTAIVAAGIPLAVRAYDRVVDVANAQTLLSTTMTALRDELGKATSIRLSKSDQGDSQNDVVTFISGKSGYVSRIVREGKSQSRSATGANLVEKNEDPKSIHLMQYAYTDEKMEVTDENLWDSSLLVSGQAATEKLHVTYESIDYDSDLGLFTISELKVTKEGESEDSSPLAYMKTYNIRTIVKKPSV